MIYIIGWALIYFFFIIQNKLHYHGKFFIFFLLFFLSMIAFLRGDIGTDTHIYEGMLASFSYKYELDNGIEPGFVALGWTVGKIAPNMEIAVRFLSLVYFFLLSLFLYWSDRNERIFLLIYILPVFAYIYSMNGLRIGLASCFILLAVQFFRREKRKTMLLFGFIGFLFHYSILIPILYLLLHSSSVLKFKNILYILLLLSLLLIPITLNVDFFLKKYDAYSNFQSPSALSGLSIIIPMFIMLISMALTSFKNDQKCKIITLGLAALILGYFLASQSYAGLRILDLLRFAIPVSILLTYQRLNARLDKVFIISLLIASLMTAFTIYLNFLGMYNTGRNSWLPYETFF
jgi:hypothetical protein